MVMNIGGVPMNLPLYDSNGVQLTPGPSFDEVNRANIGNDSELEQAQRLLKIVNEAIDKSDQSETNLNYASDDVNIYDDIDSESGMSNGGIYWSVTISGGLNGCGLWSNYLESLSNLMKLLETEFKDAWIMDVSVDCVDDIFYAVIGIKANEGQLDNL